MATIAPRLDAAPTGPPVAKAPLYPSLYQINTRVWLTELSRTLGRPATLDDIPDAELDRLAAIGFDWVWLLSVWQTGPAGAAHLAQQSASGAASSSTRCPISATRTSPARASRSPATPCTRRSAATRRWPGCASGFAQRGLRLMLDFVPNHTAPDHPWVREHPEYYVAGTEADLARSAAELHPRRASAAATVVLAYGRDPYFAGWPDTLQLDYSNPATQEAMIGELLRIAGQCDGVRCDMAMLVLPDVFERTWGRRAPLVLARCDRRASASAHPGFCFMAEVYWDLEWTLQQQGFDYAYDKRLYDRLRDGHARPVREHLHAGLDYQSRLARFLENHDEPRAAATFAPAMHEAAAIVTFLSPGLRFFHQGQFEGRMKRISPHLVRGPGRAVPTIGVQRFYDRLLAALRDRSFATAAGGCSNARRHGTATGRGTRSWRGTGRGGGQRAVVAVNYADHQSQCYLRVPLHTEGAATVRLRDEMGAATYDRPAGDLGARGLFLDMPAWGYHVFDVTAI